MADRSNLTARVTARLSSAEATVLAAACELAGVDTANWIRHVLFGEPVMVRQPAQDAAVRDDLTRLGSLIVIIRDRVTRTHPDPDPSLLLLADMGCVVLDAERRLSEPYTCGVVDSGDSVPDAKREHAIRVRVSRQERTLVVRAAEDCDMAVGPWLGAAIVAGGRPVAPAVRCDAGGVQATTDALLALTKLVSVTDPVALAAGLATSADHVRDGIRKAVRP